MNTVSIIGNVAADAELAYTKSGKAVTKFTVAVSDRFNKENTFWFDIMAWGKTAELCGEYLKRGNKVGITGRLTTRTYENREGKNVKVTEIVAEDVTFLTPKKQDKQGWDDIATERGDDEFPC